MYGCGQPTEEAMIKIIDQIKKGTENEKIIWVNMRSEPVIYINGAPHAAREPEFPHGNIQQRSLTIQEATVVGKHFSKIVANRAKENAEKQIKVHVDKEYNDNPMDRVDIEETIVVESVKDLEAVYQACREACNVDLQVYRIPLVEDMVPAMSDFDAIIELLKDEPASTACVFSCQMGKGRTTVGICTALLIKEIQLSAQLR